MCRFPDYHNESVRIVLEFAERVELNGARDRVRALIQEGRVEEARAVCGEAQPPAVHGASRHEDLVRRNIGRLERMLDDLAFSDRHE